jgi:hypothetical protein
LYNIDIGESAIGIHVESNDHAIDADLGHCLLDFIIPSRSDCEVELVLISPQCCPHGRKGGVLAH